jgi:hypothetical protein
MPRIDDRILECIIYLYGTPGDAERGERVGGSGFFVGIPSEIFPSRSYVYAVTNSHIIRETQSPVIRLNRTDGSFEIVDVPADHWVHHPDGDDIAAVAVGGLNQEIHMVKWVPRSLFLTKELIAQYNIGPGDDTFVVGRFINHEGRQRNLPSVRFGHISMMPDEPLLHERGHLQESFVIETHSIGGYSGSPVFVSISPFSWRPEGRDMKVTTFGPWLVGVDWGHIRTKEPVREKNDDQPVFDGWYVHSNLGMVGVVPSWKLDELLHSGDLLVNRQKEDERYRAEAAKDNVVELDSLAETFSEEDFEQALRQVSRPVNNPSEPDEASSQT